MFKKLARVFFNFALCLIAIGVILVSSISYIYWHVKPTLPSADFLNEYQAPELTHVYDRHFQLIQEFAPVHRINIKFSDIPEKIIAAFLVAEDKNFYYHPGIDPLRIIRALFQNVTLKKSPQNLVGASTITQQVAKNFLVGNEKSMLRKFREAFATISIERKLSKDHILELYLNQIYLGNGAYGIQSAALKYFNKSVENLSIAQACLLAALPKAPGSLSVSKNIQKLTNRRNAIIQALLEQGYINKTEADNALSEPIEIKENETIFENYNYYLLPLKDAFHEQEPQLNLTAGLEIFSCMDAKFQQVAQATLRERLLKYDLKQKIFIQPLGQIEQSLDIDSKVAALKQIIVPDCPKNYQKAVVSFKEEKITVILENAKEFPLDCTGWSFENKLVAGDVILVEIKGRVAHIRQIPEISGAIVVMEAKTGHVLAMVGGWSSTANQFNCATQAIRQPGSCFKPFVYLAALENGYSTNDIIDDEPITLILNNGKEIYKPKNIDGKTHGAVSVKEALAKSYNLASLNLAMKTGFEHVQDIADLFGIYNKTPKHPAMILGASETTLLKLTTAYAMIYNGGYHIKPQFFTAYTQRKPSCVNKNTTICEIECQKNFSSIPLTTLKDNQQLASPQAIFGMLEMLRAVITHGTGRSLQPLEKKLGVTFSGKTGTTNNNMDAWFIGSVSIPGTIYQDNNPLVIGVFVGFLKPKNLGKGNGGAAIAMPIYSNFIKNVLSGTLMRVESF